MPPGPLLLLAEKLPTVAEAELSGIRFRDWVTMAGMSDSSPSYGALQPETSVCPRHPDRPTLIRCQRCEEPTCVECQRSAPVGVQCVDCVRSSEEYQRAVQPRTAVGATPLAAKPIVTFTIMGICGVLFVLQMVGLDPLLSDWAMFAPIKALAMPWTFITSGFLHADLMHVGLNLWALWAVGQYLERALGHWRFAVLFLLSVIGGHVAVLALAQPALPPIANAWITGTVGASGGVFGLFGALFVLQRRMGEQTTQILVLVGLNFLLPLMNPQISWQGHLGGLVVGVAFAALMFQFRPKATPGANRAALARRSALWHGAIAVGVLLVLAGIAAGSMFRALQAGAPLPLLF